MVHPPKKNLSALPAGKFGKSKNPVTLKRHHANSGKSGLEAERIRALNNLRSLRSYKKKQAGKSKEISFMTAEEKERWIKSFVENETAGARQRLEEAEAALHREREAANDTSTGAVAKKTFEEMLKEIGEDLENVINSADEEDEVWEYEEDDEEKGLTGSEDEEDWVPGTVNKKVQQRLEARAIRRKKVEEVALSGWEDAEQFFRSEREHLRSGSASKHTFSSASGHHDDAGLPPALPSSALSSSAGSLATSGSSLPLRMAHRSRHKRIASISTDSKAEPIQVKKAKSGEVEDEMEAEVMVHGSLSASPSSALSSSAGSLTASGSSLPLRMAHRDTNL